MDDSAEKIKVLERLLVNVNLELKAILPAVTDPGFTDSDVRDSVIRAEKASRYVCYRIPAGREGYDHAFARAEAKAKQNGEVFVVASKEGVETFVIMPKSRLMAEQPFGLGEEDVIYTSTGAKA